MRIESCLVMDHNNVIMVRGFEPCDFGTCLLVANCMD